MAECKEKCTFEYMMRIYLNYNISVEKFSKLFMFFFKFKVNDGQFDFMVSHIEDPSEFYIHPISLESSQSIDKMTNEINAYFSR